LVPDSAQRLGPVSSSRFGHGNGIVSVKSNSQSPWKRRVCAGPICSLLHCHSSWSDCTVRLHGVTFRVADCVCEHWGVLCLGPG
jgi:hypothetical protein